MKNKSGFTLIFKEVVYDGDGKPKGNCDADLVLQATRRGFEFVGARAGIEMPFLLAHAPTVLEF